MPKTVYMGGNPIQFADDVTDDEIVEFGDMQRQQSNNMRGIISPVANMIAQASMAAPVEANTLPQINGGNYAFAGKQVVQNALQQSQQSNQDRVSAQIQQRGMLQQQMEAEKDRSQQFKLEQTRMQNDIKLSESRFKLDEKLAMAKAKGDVETAKMVEASKMRLAEFGFKNDKELAQLDNSASMAETLVKVESQDRRAAMNAAQGGGGAETSLQRIQLADGTIVAWDPKQNRTVPITLPDGSPAMGPVSAAAANEPRPVDAAKAFAAGVPWDAVKAQYGVEPLITTDTLPPSLRKKVLENKIDQRQLGEDLVRRGVPLEKAKEIVISSGVPEEDWNSMVPNFIYNGSPQDKWINQGGGSKGVVTAPDGAKIRIKD